MENKNQTMKKFSLTFVRHGQSEGNSNGLLQGQSNTALSAEGRDQSRLAGLALSHIKFDQIYSSDLDRAFDTASIIAQVNMESNDVLPDENSNIVKSLEQRLARQDLLERNCIISFLMVAKALMQLRKGE